MDRLFNVNNPLMRALSKLFDIGWLSLIYVVFCVPLVTIGAATTSLYYVSAKVLRKDRGYVWSEFWHSFKLNFKPATLIWLIFAAIYGLLYFNLTTFNTSNAAGGYLVGAYIALAFIVTCVASYAFCLLSRFNMNVRGFCVMHCICHSVISSTHCAFWRFYLRQDLEFMPDSVCSYRFFCCLYRDLDLFYIRSRWSIY